MTLQQAEKAGALVSYAYKNSLDLSVPGKTLLERIDKVSASLQEDQPVVVLMGESHGAPAHKLLQAYVVKGLLEQSQKVAVSFEAPHNYLGRLVTKNTSLSLSPAEKIRLAQMDKTGQRALVTTIAFGESPYAPLSSHTIMDFYRQSGVAARFTDAACYLKHWPRPQYPDKPIIEAFLDQSDPLTATLVAHHLEAGNIRDVSAVEPLGMAIRNEMMAAQAMTHIKNSGASILIHQCGRDHVFGNREDGGQSYRDSLTSQFTKLGAAVLPVFITTGMSGLETVPKTASAALPSSVIIYGLAQQRFTEDDQSERCFIARLNQQSGTDFKVPADDVRKWLQDDIRQVAPQWVAEARQGPAGP